MQIHYLLNWLIGWKISWIWRQSILHSQCSEMLCQFPWILPSTSTTGGPFICDSPHLTLSHVNFGMLFGCQNPHLRWQWWGWRLLLLPEQPSRAAQVRAAVAEGPARWALTETPWKGTLRLTAAVVFLFFLFFSGVMTVTMMKEKTSPSGVNLMRNPVLYRAAQSNNDAYMFHQMLDVCRGSLVWASW